MRLDIYSDVVCPWCFLGHRRLRDAIAGLGGDGERIDVRWRAFQLDPRATAEPRDLREAMERKYGPGAMDAMDRRLTELGVGAGIEYRFDAVLRVGTFDAHRLIQWAQAQHAATTDALVDRLFSAYFTEGANIADVGTLTRLASEVGIDAPEG